jgi:hypothetical protein
MLVIIAVQPAGDITLVGVTPMNPAPGIQENQNVPMVVVPVLGGEIVLKHPRETIMSV